MPRLSMMIMLLCVTRFAVAAEPAKPAATDLKSIINDLHVLGTDFWIYNDLQGAIAEAKKSGKPIFVTFRCVPCKACAGFDAEVAKGSDLIAKLAREKFISLRQVEMKGVDLSQFQFDYDLNWAAMFIHADGTVLARYGTQSVDGPDAFNSIASLEKTMNRVLELHAQYDQNKAALAAKRGEAKPYKTALEMPGMENKEKLAGATARNNCIHCHMIHDAEQTQWRKEGVLSQEKLFRYPLPDNMGIHIQADHGRKIESVLADSAAGKAGLKAGDEITHINGQPITSIADMQWVFHNLPGTESTLNVIAQRDGKAMEQQIKLLAGWKKIDFKWRGSRWSLKPNPGFWGPLAKDAEIKGLKLDEGVKPIRVQWINAQRTEGKSAKAAGLKEGDIIVAVNGKPMNMTPEQFQMDVRLNHKTGETLKLSIFRNGKAMEIDLPLVE